MSFKTHLIGPISTVNTLVQARKSSLLGLLEQALNTAVLSVSPPDPSAMDDLPKMPTALSHFLAKTLQWFQMPTGDTLALGMVFKVLLKEPLTSSLDY